MGLGPYSKAWLSKDVVFVGIFRQQKSRYGQSLISKDFNYTKTILMFNKIILVVTFEFTVRSAASWLCLMRPARSKRLDSTALEHCNSQAAIRLSSLT